MFIGLLSACTTASFDGSSASNSKGHMKCVFLSNPPYKARWTFVDINFNEPLFYPFTVRVKKNDRGGNTIDDFMFQYMFQIK